MGGLPAEQAVSRRVVLCIADDRLRASIERAATRDPAFDVTVVSSCHDLPASAEADLVVLDPPIGADVARLLADVVRAHPSTSVLLLREFDDVQEFLDCLMAGAVGFCNPNAGVEAITRTIDAVLADGVAIPRNLVRPLVDALRQGRGHLVDTPTGAVRLTRREWEVLLLIRQHRSTAEIAQEMFVSKATVRSHVAAVLRKLGARDRDEAIALLDPA